MHISCSKPRLESFASADFAQKIHIEILPLPAGTRLLWELGDEGEGGREPPLLPW